MCWPIGIYHNNSLPTSWLPCVFPPITPGKTSCPQMKKWFQHVDILPRSACRLSKALPMAQGDACKQVRRKREDLSDEGHNEIVAISSRPKWVAPKISAQGFKK